MLVLVWRVGVVRQRLPSGGGGTIVGESALRSCTLHALPVTRHYLTQRLLIPSTFGSCLVWHSMHESCRLDECEICCNSTIARDLLAAASQVHPDASPTNYTTSLRANEDRGMVETTRKFHNAHSTFHPSPRHAGCSSEGIPFSALVSVACPGRHASIQVGRMESSHFSVLAPSRCWET